MFDHRGRVAALGTDAGFPPVRHGTNAQELEFLVENGLSPMEAAQEIYLYLLKEGFIEC